MSTRLICAFLTVLLISLATAQVPELISFQGRLADATGTPVPDGSYFVTFRIYESETGGSAVWSEIQNVTTANGLFSVMLGSVTSFGTDVDFSIPLWLSIEIGSEGELSPRYQLGSSPYAFVSILADSSMYSMYSMNAMYAQNAVSADSAGISGLAHSVDWSDITSMPAGFADGVDDEGSGGATYTAGDGIDITDTVISVADDGITTAKIADDAVTTAKIADEAVTGAKIAQMSALSGQVLKWNGTVWAPANDATGSGGTGVDSIIVGSGLTGGGSGVVNIALASGGVEWDNLSTAVQESILSGGGAGLDQVHHTGDFIGNGTIGNPLVIADDVIDWDRLTSAVQESIQSSGAAGLDQVHHTAAFTGTGAVANPLDLADGAATTSKIADNAVTPAKIDPTGGSAGQVLKIVAGTVQWANDEGGGAGLTQVYHSAEFTGTGESANPLYLADDGITDEKLDLTDITVSDFTNDAGYLTAADLNDDDATNELITAFNWTDASDQLTITEAGTPWTVTIDNEADDLSDNNIGDLANVDVSSVSDGDVLKWNSTLSVWEPGTDSIDLSLWTDNGTYINPNNNSDVYIYDSGQTDGIVVNNATHYAGRFYYDGDNMAALGSSDGYGVFGRGTSYGVRGYHAGTGHYGQLGTPLYAGEFHGDVYVTDSLYVDGKVGIGTTTPVEKLTVDGNIVPNADNSYDLGSSDLMWHDLYVSNRIYSRFSDYTLYLYSNGGYHFDLDYDNDNVGTTVDFQVVSPVAPDAFIIKRNGNVGIGTDSPDEELVVGTPLGSGWAIPAITVGDTSSGGGIEVGNGTYKLQISASNIFGRARIKCSDDGGVGDGDIEFICNAVGIGTGTPEDPLYVKHTVTSHSSTNSPTITGFVTDGADTMIGILAGQNGYQGVYGKTTRNSGYGVYGKATGSGGYGVYGRATGSGGYGVNGYATGGDCIGVSALASGSGTSNRGVYCHGSGATNNYGVWGYGSGGTNNYGVYGQGDTYGVYASGNLGCSGTKPAVVRTSEGPREMYAMESPNLWFEDIGGGTITSGRCHIAISSDFAEAIFIDDTHPFQVFITPYANIGNWWIERGDNGFTLIAPDAADGATFAYRITALRKGYEDLRMKHIPGLYTDHFLYPDINDVPQKYREEWSKMGEQRGQQ